MKMVKTKRRYKVMCAVGVIVLNIIDKGFLYGSVLGVFKHDYANFMLTGYLLLYFLSESYIVYVILTMGRVSSKIVEKTDSRIGTQTKGATAKFVPNKPSSVSPAKSVRASLSHHASGGLTSQIYEKVQVKLERSKRSVFYIVAVFPILVFLAYVMFEKWHFLNSYTFSLTWVGFPIVMQIQEMFALHTLLISVTNAKERDDGGKDKDKDKGGPGNNSGGGSPKKTATISPK
jgi:hypothetical protein